MTRQVDTRSRSDGKFFPEMAIAQPPDPDGSLPEPVTGWVSQSKTGKPGPQDFTSLVTVTRRSKTGATVTKQRYRTQPADFVGIGILVSAAGAVIVSAILATALLIGRIDGREALKIVATCVGGSTIALIVGVATRRPFAAKDKCF
jgi:hypothetical protein